jgi:PPOX class probable F420-dependent enzyme
MRLEHAEAMRRLLHSDHAVLATLHPRRGADMVPVCFVIRDSIVAIPVDRVKEKRSTRLQRVRNLEADPRATLLSEEWDPREWSSLWWVRAQLVATEVTDEVYGGLLAALREKYHQYRGAALDSLTTLRIDDITGWSAT